MAIRKLSLDDFFQDEDFSLIGIHCTIKDYRLAYLLNKALTINLCRKAQDVDNENSESYFSIFEWENEAQFSVWNLVSNTCKIESNQLQPVLNSLFEEPSVRTQTHYLVPEFKQANYLLKVENQLPASREKHILTKILDIPQVVTAYSIMQDQLKSKENVIFN